MSPSLLLGIAVGVVVVAAVVWALVDLSRREVAHLPRGAWAVMIVLLSIFGVGIYVLVGRIPADGGQPLLTRLRSDEEEGQVEYMVWGMVLGMIVGTALGQIALGLAVGLTVGALIDAYRARRGHG